MKRAILIAAALTFGAGSVFGALGDIYASFPAPASYPIALARANNPDYTWVYCNTSPYRIYRINAHTGSIFASYVSPQGIGTRGLTYNYGGGGGLPLGSYLWMGNYLKYYIYRCNYATGSAYASFPAYSSTLNGLAVKATGHGGYCPTHMLSSNANTERVYHKDLITGSIRKLFTASHDVYDLAYDWENEIIWTGNLGNVVYGYNTNGSLVTSFTIPANYPLGFAHQHNFLWVGTTLGSHRIWKIHCPPFTASANVVPASMGKIKAAFR